MNHAPTKTNTIAAIACVLSLVGPVFCSGTRFFFACSRSFHGPLCAGLREEAPGTRARINKRTYIIYKSLVRRSARPSREPRPAENRNTGRHVGWSSPVIRNEVESCKSRRFLSRFLSLVPRMAEGERGGDFRISSFFLSSGNKNEILKMKKIC